MSAVGFALTGLDEITESHGQDYDWESDQRTWLASALGDVTVELEDLSPSEWAEATRYMPPGVTSIPGFYRFAVTPYLREPLDCLSPSSPIQFIAMMKGAQVGATVGLLENTIGYYIDKVKTAPMMLVTADGELAKLRIDGYISPMIQHSGLDELIKSSDKKRSRKTGITDKRIDWEGGGSLVPFGAQNANKLRSVSIQILLRDETDGWPQRVGMDGDPMALSENRTVAYSGNRKILDLSTPLIKGLSQIEAQYKLGDQRKYHVCCLSCGGPQELRWKRLSDSGVVSGIVWKVEDGRLVHDSVRYICMHCGHAHGNDDKTRLLDPAHGARWVPTAEPSTPERRSYHISALYSPVGMQTWASCVHKWMLAWDDERNVSRDLGALQVFYNNVLGQTFELQGEKLRLRDVSPHRREEYAYGEVPNSYAVANTGGAIVLLTCAVDVHKDNLAVAVMGWTEGQQSFLIDYWTLTGDTEQLDDPGTWGALRDIIEKRIYVADDGARYRIQLTLVDSGYRTEQAYSFAAEYESSVYPIKGRASAASGATVKEFGEFTTTMGTTAFGITVDLYKDRWSAALRKTWSGQGLQKAGQFNAPRDATDKQLGQLTVEVKREKIEKRTGKRLGHEWHRPGGSKNELWDLVIYNNAALDMIAWNVCVGQLGMDRVSFPEFFRIAQDSGMYRGA